MFSKVQIKSRIHFDKIFLHGRRMERYAKHMFLDCWNEDYACCMIEYIKKRGKNMFMSYTNIAGGQSLFKIEEY